MNKNNKRLQDLLAKERTHEDCLRELPKCAYLLKDKELLYDLAMDDHFLRKQNELFSHENYAYQTLLWTIELQDNEHIMPLLDKLESLCLQNNNTNFLTTTANLEYVMKKINLYSPNEFFKAQLYLIWLQIKKDNLDNIDYIIANSKVAFDWSRRESKEFFVWWTKNTYAKISLERIFKILDLHATGDYVYQKLAEMFLEQQQIDLAYRVVLKMPKNKHTYNDIVVQVAQKIWEQGAKDKLRSLLQVANEKHHMHDICKFHLLLGQNEEIHRILSITYDHYRKYQIYNVLAEVTTDETGFKSWARKACSEIEHQLQGESWSPIRAILQHFISNPESWSKNQVRSLFYLCNKIKPNDGVGFNLETILEWSCKCSHIDFVITTNEAWNEAYCLEQTYAHALKNKDDDLAQHILRHAKRVAQKKMKSRNHFQCIWFDIFKVLHQHDKHHEIQKIFDEQPDILLHCLKGYRYNVDPLLTIPFFQKKILDLMESPELDHYRKSIILMDMASHVSNPQQLIEKSLSHTLKIRDNESKYTKLHNILHFALQKNYMDLTYRIVDIFQTPRAKNNAYRKLMKKLFEEGKIQQGLDLYRKALKNNKKIGQFEMYYYSFEYADFIDVPNDNAILSSLLEIMNHDNENTSTAYPSIVEALIQFDFYDEALVLVEKLSCPTQQAKVLLSIVNNHIKNDEQSRTMTLLKHIENINEQIEQYYNYVDIGIEICSLYLKIGTEKIEERFKLCCQNFSKVHFNTCIKFRNDDLIMQMITKFVAVAQQINLQAYLEETVKDNCDIHKQMQIYKMNRILEKQILTKDDKQILETYMNSEDAQYNAYYVNQIQQKLLQKKVISRPLSSKCEPIYAVLTSSESSIDKTYLQDVIKKSPEATLLFPDLVQRLQKIGCEKSYITEMIEWCSKNSSAGPMQKEIILHFAALGDTEKVKEKISLWEEEYNKRLVTRAPFPMQPLQQRNMMKQELVQKIVHNIANSNGEKAISFIQNNCPKQEHQKLMSIALTSILQGDEYSTTKKIQLAKKYVNTHSCLEILLCLAQNGLWNEIHPQGNFQKLPIAFKNNNESTRPTFYGNRNVYEELAYIAAQQQKYQQVNSYIQCIDEITTKAQAIRKLGKIFAKQHQFGDFCQLLKQHKEVLENDKTILHEWTQALLGFPTAVEYIKQLLSILPHDEDNLIYAAWMLKIALWKSKSNLAPNF